MRACPLAHVPMLTGHVQGRCTTVSAFLSPRKLSSASRGGATAQRTSAFGNRKSSIFNTIPSKLLPPIEDPTMKDQIDGVDALTVYCVRFTTGYARGAALSEPYSAINILLVGEEGKAILKRIPPLNDPAAAVEQMDVLCQIVDASVGVNCCTTLSQAAQPSTSTPIPPSCLAGKSLASGPSTSVSKPQYAQPKLRFQEGQVDELSFLAQELGPLHGILIGTERGSWLLDEVDVSSSRTAHIDRFVCREKLGVRAGAGAMWLMPVPPGASVYGSGESTIILTKEDAAALRAMHLSEYDDVKSRMLLTSLALTVGGSGAAGLMVGMDAAVPFALGGAAGLCYQWLLQLGVDGMVGKIQESKGLTTTATPGGSSSSPSAATAAEAAAMPTGSETGAERQRKQDEKQAMGTAVFLPTLSRLLSGVAASPVVRLGFIAAVSLVGVSSLHSQGPMQQAAVASCEGLQCMVGSSTKEGAWKLLFGVLGFLTYKLAIVSASLSPPTIPEAPATSPRAKSSIRTKDGTTD